MKYLNGSVTLEGNYYTAGHTPSAFPIGASWEGQITTRLGWDTPEEKKMRFVPFVEGSLSQASIGGNSVNTSIGYPYWMIDSRLFGGGGLLWRYGKTDDDFRMALEASYFFDDYTDQFQRFTGEIQYQIFDYTAIAASFEIYAQEKFYSNTLLLGVKYNLKTKKKK